jgi:hypothetical protein
MPAKQNQDLIRRQLQFATNDTRARGGSELLEVDSWPDDRDPIWFDAVVTDEVVPSQSARGVETGDPRVGDGPSFDPDARGVSGVADEGGQPVNPPDAGPSRLALRDAGDVENVRDPRARCARVDDVEAFPSKLCSGILGE